MLDTAASTGAAGAVPEPLDERAVWRDPELPFADAARLWRRALYGEAEAQYELGIKHMRGAGVTRNEREGAKWLRRSAAQGHRAGQLNLGVAFALGRGVRQSDLQAYMWFSLAAMDGDDRAVSYCIRIVRRMAAEDIEDAERMALEWERGTAH